jgi:hypothetical protein
MRSRVLFSLVCFIPLACSDGGPVGRDQLNALVEGGGADGQTACQSAGGKCMPGPTACAVEAPAAAQDCAPANNPGGVTCCLPETAPDAGPGSLCESAGGQCVLGNVSCAEQAPNADQDCNPDKNPGGSFCCLSTSKKDASAACTWPPTANTTDGGSGPGCVPKPEFKICEGSPKKCHDACTAAEYSLTCTGSGTPATIPDPPASLDCKAIAIPTPSNQLYYCCPCAK